MKQCRLGYEKLNLDEKLVYDNLLNAFITFSDSVDSNRFKKNIDLMKVLNVVGGDNPSIIHFNKSQIKLSSSMFSGKQIKLCGTYSRSQINKIYSELESKVEFALNEIELLNPITIYDKLICIYEYLQDNVTYDEQELEQMCRTGNIANPFSHNAYGALINGRAVCDGIVAAFSLIAQRMGIESTMVAGKAKFYTTDFSNHAWNLIRVDDKCYHVDATWDINKKDNTGEYSYDYFCVDDVLISSNHHWNINTTHVCDYNDLSFYSRNKCYANNLSQVEEMFLRYAKSKQQFVRVRIREGIAIPGSDQQQYLGQLLMSVASKAGRNVPFEYYWNDDTRCFFAKFKQ